MRGKSSLYQAQKALPTVFAGWFGSHCGVKIDSPGDDSCDGQNTAIPPVIVIMQYCVEARSDPGPIDWRRCRIWAVRYVLKDVLTGLLGVIAAIGLKRRQLGFPG